MRYAVVLLVLLAGCKGGLRKPDYTELTVGRSEGSSDYSPLRLQADGSSEALFFTVGWNGSIAQTEKIVREMERFNNSLDVWMAGLTNAVETNTMVTAGKTVVLPGTPPPPPPTKSIWDTLLTVPTTMDEAWVGLVWAGTLLLVLWGLVKLAKQGLRVPGFKVDQPKKK